MKIRLDEIKEPVVRQGMPKAQIVSIEELTEDGKDSSFQQYNLRVRDIIQIPDDIKDIKLRQVYIRKPTEEDIKSSARLNSSNPYEGIPKATLMSVSRNGMMEWMTVASLRHYGYLKNENGEFIPCPLDDVAENLKNCKNDYERIVACAGKTIMAEGFITAYVDKWVDGVKTDEKYERNIICLKFIE